MRSSRIKKKRSNATSRRNKQINILHLKKINKAVRTTPLALTRRGIRAHLPAYSAALNERARVGRRHALASEEAAHAAPGPAAPQTAVAYGRFHGKGSARHGTSRESRRNGCSVLFGGGGFGSGERVARGFFGAWPGGSGASFSCCASSCSRRGSCLGRGRVPKRKRLFRVVHGGALLCDCQRRAAFAVNEARVRARRQQAPAHLNLQHQGRTTQHIYLQFKKKRTKARANKARGCYVGFSGKSPPRPFELPGAMPCRPRRSWRLRRRRLFDKTRKYPK